MVNLIFKKLNCNATTHYHEFNFVDLKFVVSPSSGCLITPQKR